MKFACRPAIDGEERLLRMNVNVQRDVPRLQPLPVRPGLVAICGYGPSLRESWKAIATPFVCTTSGAHDFLIEREIIPRWHVEYDPREHKLEFLRHPHQGTTYCLASTCHPQMFELVRDHKVLLWHALGNTVREDCTLVQQHEDDGILLLGGSNAGARAIMVMHVLGFRNFDLHGVDCSYKPDTIWAGPHSGPEHHAFKVECNGKEFLTSEPMINSAEEIWKTMTQQLNGCNFSIHGDGLLAERMRLLQTNREAALGEWWKPIGIELKKVAVNPVGQLGSVITDRYREQNRLMHEWNPEYGSYSGRHALVVKELADVLGTTDILDYGCGKRKLEFGLGFKIKNYDPAISGLDASPEPADLVVCTDTLEHIEPECLEAVFADLKRVTKKQLFVTISTRPATKTLIDGRNAHLIVRDAEWWKQMLQRHFRVLRIEPKDGEVMGLFANADLQCLGP